VPTNSEVHPDGVFFYFNDVGNKHFVVVVSSVKDLCENVEAQQIIDFITETHF